MLDLPIHYSLNCTIDGKDYLLNYIDEKRVSQIEVPPRTYYYNIVGNGKILLVNFEYKILKAFKFKSGELLYEIGIDRRDNVTDIVGNNDCFILGRLSNIEIRNVFTGAIIKNIPDSRREFMTIANNLKYYLVNIEENRTSIIYLNNGEELIPIENLKGSRGFKFTLDSKYLVILLEKMLKIVDCETGNVYWETVLPQMNNGMHLIINILNQIIVTDTSLNPNPYYLVNLKEKQLITLKEPFDYLINWDIHINSELLEVYRSKVMVISNSVMMREKEFQFKDVIPLSPSQKGDYQYRDSTNCLISPLPKLYKLLATIRILKNTLRRQHPMIFPREIVAEVVNKLVAEIMPSSPRLIAYLMDIVDQPLITREQFDQGFYAVLNS